MKSEAFSLLAALNVIRASRAVDINSLRQEQSVISANPPKQALDLLFKLSDWTHECLNFPTKSLHYFLVTVTCAMPKKKKNPRIYFNPIKVL